MKSTPPICPRCKSSMSLMIQSENRGNRNTIVYMYVCPVCRNKTMFETVELELNTNSIMIKVIKSKNKVS